MFDQTSYSDIFSLVIVFETKVYLEHLVLGSSNNVSILTNL